MILISFVQEWLAQVIDQLEELIPRLVKFLGILIVAYVIGRILAWLVATILRKLEFERLTRKSEAERIARRFGMSLIGLIGLVVKWTIYLIGLQIAVEAAGLEILNRLMRGIVSYMPNLILALAIFIVGILIAEKVGNFVQGLAEDEKVPRFWILGNLVRYTIYLVVMIMALSQLKISTDVLIIVTGSIFVTIGLTVVISLRDIGPNVAAGIHLLYEKTLNIGDTVKVGEYEGIIEDIGIVKSIIKNEEGEFVVIPNSRLMRSTIIKRLSSGETLE
ncbi:MAG: mechanosensitive ion channel [Theionarchaea archaeon]|nr:mechanosensitive ion channel [Theionarchaea archaeon]MBU6999445.1 mechanosensitive ion channel [Theionarchaea archaeon]MBU7022352.1 mechanosensitive ion channel [Theionarchaea archaeon]MBU7035871.1 mechanosensitive ion channel [Theionarchaea archaeon]MBU7041928.1 mechanosensitive ion channel [Theionarchaea archaeon]